ncbi:MAG: transporter substrate-binding domain-containing protein [Proteobacteria bacterium]|nr:transporter substrate-binding domain-containing protein [Pseudomonadota bacterium]MBU1687223.1 transporter substrate-binding domain-containing protein [Pseudomonadota bacterium]
MNRRMVFLLTLTFLVPVFISPCHSASPPELLITTPATPPYHYPDQTGFLDQWLKAAFQEIGVKVSVEWLPPERSLLNANEGLSDGDAIRIGGLEKEYPNLIRVPEVIFQGEYGAFSQTVEVLPQGWASLSPYDVGIIRGIKLTEQNLKEAHSIIRVENAQLLFGLLQQNRVDLVICERLFGLAVAKKMDIPCRFVEPPLSSLELFLYLNQKHAGLVPELTTAIREMKKEGIFLQKIKDWAQAQSRKE